MTERLLPDPSKLIDPRELRSGEFGATETIIIKPINEPEKERSDSSQSIPPEGANGAG